MRHVEPVHRQWRDAARPTSAKRTFDPFVRGPSFRASSSGRPVPLYNAALQHVPMATPVPGPASPGFDNRRARLRPRGWPTWSNQ